jgi:hypothetical protein
MVCVPREVHLPDGCRDFTPVLAGESPNSFQKSGPSGAALSRNQTARPRLPDDAILKVRFDGGNLNLLEAGVFEVRDEIVLREQSHLQNLAFAVVKHGIVEFFQGALAGSIDENAPIVALDNLPFMQVWIVFPGVAIRNPRNGKDGETPRAQNSDQIIKGRLRGWGYMLEDLARDYEIVCAQVGRRRMKDVELRFRMIKGVFEYELR